MNHVDRVYFNMVEEFKKSQNKSEMIRMLKDFCRDNTNQHVYDLKKMLFLNFSMDVKCQYCYLRSTPTNYGCDLREIFYDRNNNLIDDGKKVLDLFYEKKVGSLWHIMTDIDDTLYPNTEKGTYIAGSDISWMEKHPYPGIKKMYELLYKKKSFSNHSTVLSATPGCLKTSKLKDSHHLLHDILGTYGFIQGIEGKGQILSHVGDMASNFLSSRRHETPSELSNLFTLFGMTKFERFKQYLTLFPEHNILFIGDNGQGDVLAGIEMLEHIKSLPNPPLCHVFIHKVYDGQQFKQSKEEGQIVNMHFFENYLELAHKLRDIAILDDDDVREIDDEVMETTRHTEFAHLYANRGGKRRIRKQKTKRRRLFKRTRKN
jgi:hypothetical protein